MSRRHFKILVSRYYEKTALNGYIYDFSGDYNAIAVDAIFNIHNYLMKKNNMI